MEEAEDLLDLGETTSGGSTHESWVKFDSKAGGQGRSKNGMVNIVVD
jgi:hypothetical protein